MNIFYLYFSQSSYILFNTLHFARSELFIFLNFKIKNNNFYQNLFTFF